MVYAKPSMYVFGQDSWLYGHVQMNDQQLVRPFYANCSISRYHSSNSAVMWQRSYSVMIIILRYVSVTILPHLLLPDNSNITVWICSQTRAIQQNYPAIVASQKWSSYSVVELPVQQMGGSCTGREQKYYIYSILIVLISHVQNVDVLLKLQYDITETQNVVVLIEQQFGNTITSRVQKCYLCNYVVVSAIVLGQ